MVCYNELFVNCYKRVIFYCYSVRVVGDFLENKNVLFFIDNVVIICVINR